MISTIIRQHAGFIRPTSPIRLVSLIGLMLLLYIPATAQIRIGGNVYGGGNQGNVKGSTKVTVANGDIGYTDVSSDKRPLENPRGRVFGGARMANVGGNAFVHIDGDGTNETGYIVINQVYGGNDIAGTIGTGERPTELTGIRENPLVIPDPKNEKLDSIDNTWNSFVRVSTKTMDPAVSTSYYTQAEIDAAANDPEAAAYGKRTTDIKPDENAKKIYIGQLFAGGNGDFDYEQSNPEGGKVTHTIYNRSDTRHLYPLATKVTDEGEVGFQLPELDKTYLEVNGGSIVYAYGGGNNATVKKKTVIHIDNPSAVVNHIYVDGDWKEDKTATEDSHAGRTDLLTTARFKEMGINTTFSQPSSGAYQVGRFFGGNNLAEMKIRPVWNLIAGKVRNLYGGGNKGAMTTPEGLIMEVPTYSSLIVDNLYGGCRMADVMPSVNGVYTPCTNLTRANYPNADLKQDYKFPNELAARTLVRGGHIHNVYGGNDVTGTVYGGNAVGIYTTVYGDVYGGGNGNYPYTDRMELETNGTFGDFYYGNLITGGKTSNEALKEFRPNAEQVSIRLKGEAPATENGQPNYTVVRGSIYVGGNCATLKTKKCNPLVELKMGSYVIADKVFLGNNGAGMVDEENLKYYAGKIDENDQYSATDGKTFSNLNLKDKSVFANFMEGVCMNLHPRLVFDAQANSDPDDYKDYTSYVGSFYCGGNIGSMGIQGKNTYRIDKKLNIFEKFVGGCNDAYVPEGTYNAYYEGGVIGATDERTNFKDASGNIKDRLQIDLENLTITPLRWNDTFTQVEAKKLTADKTYYYKDAEGGSYESFTAKGTETVDGSIQYYEYIESKYVPVEVGKLTAGQEYYTTDLRTSVFVADGTETIDADHTYFKLTTLGDRLVWNTAKWNDAREDFESASVPSNTIDEDARLLNGNIFGGCYDSGIVNGNVIVNINQDVLNKDDVFGSGPGIYNREKSGVKYENQRDDLDAVALTVFGAGCGKGTEIWGSATVNHNNGYVFQIFGGGDEGYVGQKKKDADGKPERVAVTDDNGDPVLDENDNPIYEYVYEFNPAYSTIVNLQGKETANAHEGPFDDLAETEYIYGGGNEGDVCGNTLVNLGNGRIYDAFGGASDADILGHAEVYIGRQPKAGGGYQDGFPWIRDIVYGGNDFGGTIHGNYEEGYDFEARIKDYSTDKASQLQGNPSNTAPNLLKSASYVEYLQGRVDSIFGGGYGYYNYKLSKYAGSKIPYQSSSFVNIRPNQHDRNSIAAVLGGGTGYPKYREGDNAQDRSYVLIDIHDSEDQFAAMDVYGAGSYNGIGMGIPQATTFAPGYNRDNCSAIIDLFSGQIANAYGGSYNEGNTCRTVVNVPAQSSINIKNIYGGAYGTQILPPCDVIQAIVNYNNTSENARVTGSIYGGNNHERRALFTQVNISSPVWSDKSKGYLATIYGAGRGIDTWSEHTQVILNKNAKVFEVYGGGEEGHVLNAESVQKYMQLYQNNPSPQISEQDPTWSQNKYWNLDGKGKKTTFKASDRFKPDDTEDTRTNLQAWQEDWEDAWEIGGYYSPVAYNAVTDTYADFDNYVTAYEALASTSLVRKAEIDDRDYSAYSETEKEKRQNIYNTNVIINEGAEVVNYAYGGGLGTGEHLSGDIYGTTYIALLGGTVKKDIYAAGTAGAVNDVFGVGAYYYNTENDKDPKNNPTGFTASTTAYIKGGSVRNVYGGGWQGHVGYHTGDINASTTGDRPAETHVVIGDMTGTSFTSGIPTVQRNAYGGGEGGAVFGTAYLTLNNGYVGYYYNADGTDDPQTKGYDERYVEKIEDDTKTTPNTLLTEAGCLFGGGYIDNSSVDKTQVTINGGHVRHSAFGGGEVAAIGRGDMKEKPSGTDYELKGIYRPGKTLITMYDGHVHQNVFGGGRGYNNLGVHGSLHCDGYVFGQTEVRIHGGEIGTAEGMAEGDGNVFGGGDIGCVYSAYENADGSFGKGVKDGVRYDPLYQGYYYQHGWEDSGDFVTVEVPTSYYTAAEAAAYNETNHLTETDGGYKKEGDVKTTKTERQFTEDCKVLVEPHLKVITPVRINGHAYEQGEFVSIEDLNTMQDKSTDAARWSCLDEKGIIIHNAVFAGGNAVAGSTTTSANTNTVFGNATASINDIYHRDMITMGTRHSGGLYGDGNLTLVDGYRELNITNYGTDYYSIAQEIDINTYHAMPEREAAYYELNYTCLKTCEDKLGTTYNPKDPNNSNSKAATITADDMLDLFLEEVNGTYVSIKNDANGKYVTQDKTGTPVLSWNSTKKEWEPNTADGAGFWEESGVLPVYAGRLMNSIQRADFCGVFGSRMVMQGAQDRVPDEADYTNYTINRVREVSLNKMDSKIASDLAIEESSDEYYKKHTHGNYFGIYNVVNYLGALTSDVHFTDKRVTSNNNTDLYGPEVVRNEDGTPTYEPTNPSYYVGDDLTYYNWKKKHIKDKTRNNGNSHNKVALASGVYLEITTEESTGEGLYEKVWGPITGVVELDLINVATGIGGGFVYAKNVHGEPKTTGAVNTTLTSLNRGAVTKWDYDYIEINSTGKAVSTQHEWETSGNFVHSTQTIIDDCYNISNRYELNNSPMPAHFWYIKGSTYVYDQYISAYTGQPNAYSETGEIPLTIAAASHGRMKLLNVMPNRYAYYAKPGEPLGDGKKMMVNGKTYYKNDPISYWDWYLLSNYEKELFVEKTYTNCITCKIDGKEYAAGTYIMTDTEYADYKTTFPEGKTKHEYTDADNQPIKDADDNPVGDDYVFRESNNVSHGTGYLLTYEVNNPSIWDTWYTPKSNSTEGGKITLAAYEAGLPATKALYEDGPTYRLKASSGGAVLGQHEYKYGDLIPEVIYYTYEGKADDLTNYPGIKSLVTSSNGTQASFQKAYIVTNKITISGSTSDTYYNPGTAVPQSFYNDHSSDCEAAYICTKTIQLTKENVIYKDSKMKQSEATGYVTDVKNKMGATYKDMTLDAIKALTVSESLTAEKKKELINLATLRDDLETYLVQAYYCTSEPTDDEEGNPVRYYYGGDYYVSGRNYRGLEAWSSMSETDRAKFTFNYDALDLLIDPTYSRAEGQKYQYDGVDSEGNSFTTETQAKTNPAGYSVTQPVDYTAEYNSNSASPTLTNKVTVKHSNGETESDITSLTKGDELSREEFENKLVNEQRHYTAIAVKNATEEKDDNDVATGYYLAYVVHTPFQIGSTPYAVGETISRETFVSLPPTERGYVTEFKFSSDDYTSKAVYYYCREAYTIETTHKVKSVKGTNSNTYEKDATVPVGAVISEKSSDGYTGYENLTNEQKNFTIHGVSPTETSTFYVSRESDIYDLSKEKIITVIYKYDYDETDADGNVTPMSERHVLNIHLTFKSGVPTIEDITPPELILPGDYITLREPNVTPGAYEVTGGGWELFATKSEAESHVNGVEYSPNFDPLYWYQDDYYVAYYAKSYLGRTYSNAVPVKVANYHDLKKVMDATEHHYYIDHRNVKRDPKIYINDYNKSHENGLDLFKNLYDLSLVTNSSTSATDGYTVSGGKITATTGTANSALKDHALLNSQVHAERNLEFFMRTDIDHTKKWVNNPAYDANDPDETDPEYIQEDNSWTPIGSTSADCFDGVFHGDGHTISGLDHSLFNHLCGDVYNLGVMGSFTGAGIAETGGGYVESCWVKTSASSTALSPKPYPVFGNPTDNHGYQVVNSYYLTDNKNIYTTAEGDAEITYSAGSKGKVTAKSAEAFYNGELAYDLNNFYLYKRYSDHEKLSSGLSYDYFTIGEDNKPVLHMDAYYKLNDNAKYCSTGTGTASVNSKYVEDRFADGDFRYAAGEIPETIDERHWIEIIEEAGKPDREEERFSPIYPDDYIFFGQKLTFGYGEQAHQDVPTAVARDGGRLSQSSNANRVYRAPAYYRNSKMGAAYFNPTVYLAQKERLTAEQIAANEEQLAANHPENVVQPREAYPGMTAIDFAGHNATNEVNGTYALGTDHELQTISVLGSSATSKQFYPPLLDDDGLLSIQNCDETQNLLVYAPATSGDGYTNATTHGVLTSYFSEPVFDDCYYNTGDYKGYRLVEENASVIHGHLVQSDLQATNDHLLVDKQDFNCPIAYHFDTNHLMWYQRKPSDNEYVDRTSGWQGISLPFTAELVTTNQKGEITHFYSGSTTSANSDKKIGHEYWLREMQNNSELKLKSETKPDVLMAVMSYPNATGASKQYTNTFLWDYYYKNEPVHNQKDENADTYLQYRQYYNTEHTYQKYPFLAKATPYILGLPGQTYYEFDLSGKFEAANTAERITRLSRQTITFASAKAEAIGVSDTEMAGVTASYNSTNYTFKPSYMNEELTAGTDNYVLNNAGNSFDKLPATGDATKVYAFRPYFTIPSSSVKGIGTRSILFNSNTGDEFGDVPESALDGSIEIFSRGYKIVTRSHMTEPTTIRIVTVGGATITNFVLQAGETIETPVPPQRVYIVNQKKIAVK